MTAATWITMIAILLFVWGGFGVALTIAVRKEAGKRAAEDQAGGPVGDPAEGRAGAPG